MKLAFVVALVTVAGMSACSQHNDQPMPEWATAKAAYDKAYAEDESGFRSRTWDDVLTQLHAVPETNEHEHHLAMALAHDIEGRRAALGAEIAKNEAAATAIAKKDPPVAPPPAPSRFGGRPVRPAPNPFGNRDFTAEANARVQRHSDCVQRECVTTTICGTNPPPCAAQQQCIMRCDNMP